MTNFSILTNTNAQVALSNLSSVQTQLSKVQNQISTGESVSSATDNAAVFSVAQGIRANIQGYNAISTALNDSQGVTSVALTGATSVSNLLQSITSTLTSLSDNSINDQQRQTYTAQLKNQIDQVQTFINGSTYNGVNLIGSSEGTQGLNFSNYSAPTNISVLSGINGSALTVHAANLTGGTLGTDGFLGLARLVYAVGAGGSSANDTISSASLYVTGGALVSRSEINASEALAALANVANSQSAYVTGTQTAGVPSVFGSSLANFTNQVNNALGSLGADSNNIQLQLTFNQSLTNAVTTGLGSLVDANLAQASAQLTALQTQQQLATQTLSIANANPQTILSLFK